MLEPERLQANFESVKARIAAAAQQAGRAPQDVSLVVVTKGHPAETLRSLQALGIRHVGESYAQEGRAKQKELASLEGLHWHMIGHVQSRRAEQVAKHFDLVHAVDSLRLAARLDRCATWPHNWGATCAPSSTLTQTAPRRLDCAFRPSPAFCSCICRWR